VSVGALVKAVRQNPQFVFPDGMIVADLSGSHWLIVDYEADDSCPIAASVRLVETS
jgi:hypothetical protein